MSEKKYALLIASFEYDDPYFRPLKAPAQDVQALSRVLGDPAIGGFDDVKTILNQPKDALVLAIEEFFDERNRDDLLLLYFSCHGIKDQDGRLYYATKNTLHKRLVATAVPAYQVNDLIEKSTSRRKILVLDCCYSGAVAKAFLAKGDETVGAMEEFKQGQGLVTLTASDAFQYAFEGEELGSTGVFSVFTRALVDGMETGKADRDGDQLIALDELYEYAYERVRSEKAQQKPRVQGEIEGKIIIARNPRPPRPAELPPEVQEGLESPIPSVREAIVQTLGAYLRSKNKRLALAALGALRKLTEDDSLKVRSASQKFLYTFEEEDASRVKTEPERLAREKAEAEGKARTQAEAQERDNAQRLKAEREADEKRRIQEQAKRQEAEAEQKGQEAETREKLEPKRRALQAEDARRKAKAEQKAAEGADRSVIGEQKTREVRKGVLIALMVGLLALLVWYLVHRVHGAPALTLSGHQHNVNSVAWSPDGKRLATGSQDNTAKVWDAETGKELLTLSGHVNGVSSVAWNPDGKRLATGSDDSTAKVWDAGSGRELLTLSGHSSYVRSVAWSPDGKRLATGIDDSTAKVWDGETGKELLTLGGHSGSVDSVAWSPDGKRLATGSWDETAKVWDGETGKELLTLSGHGLPVASVAWSPDGNRLATGSWDKTAKVWDGKTGKELLTLSGHSDCIESVAWSPDGKRLATGSRDNTAKVWDVGTGKELRTLNGHRSWVRSVAWSPGGNRLATGSSDTTVNVWEVGSWPGS
jgi:hypothetical protein